MQIQNTPIRFTTQRQLSKERSATLEIAVAVVAYVGLMLLIMSGPLSTFRVWG